MYVTVAQQQHNLKYLALYVKILGDGLRAFLLRYQIFKYARASECMHATSGPRGSHPYKNARAFSDLSQRENILKARNKGIVITVDRTGR